MPRNLNGNPPMTNPDLRRPILAGACAAALLALSACGQGSGDKARLDRIEHRLDALEQRLGAGASQSAPPSPVPSGPAPAVGAPAASGGDASTYAPGAVAVVHAAPANARQIEEVPTDSVGGFVYTGSPITLHDLSAQGVRYTGLTGIELQGWLKTTQAGRYELGEDLHGSPGGVIVGANCVLEVWLEDRVIGSQQGVLPVADSSGGRADCPEAQLVQSRLEIGGEQRLSLVTGANLQPGLYKLRLWTVCSSAAPRAARITVDLLLKSPSDLNLRGFRSDELLHQR
jgi:hypothetical protein